LRSLFPRGCMEQSILITWKNSRAGHTKKVECSCTFMACPQAVRQVKNAQVRQVQRKFSNVRSARAGKATAIWKMALTLCLCILNPHESQIMSAIPGFLFRRSGRCYSLLRLLVPTNRPYA
jgi:hypothetical protein